MKKRICVFTGNRAEYGLLYPLLREIQRYSDLQLELLVSGAHLQKEFGETYRQIEADGFAIDAKVDIELGDDSGVGVGRSMGTGVIRYTEALAFLQPHLLIVLGDRYEAFAAATGAMIMRIPIAHLHGGEATFGLIDEAIRHSITKMSQLHFTSTEEYRRRVIQLGENPDKVFNVGALGLDNLHCVDMLSREQVAQELDIVWQARNLLVTFHPVTLEEDALTDQCAQLLNALEQCRETAIIFTRANVDMEGGRINRMIENFADNHPQAFVFSSLGQKRYLSLLQYVDAMVGNSSSGIIEAASFKLPVVNIGSRQRGRDRGHNVVDVGHVRADIKQAVETQFARGRCERDAVYGDGNAGARIAEAIAASPLSIDKMLAY